MSHTRRHRRLKKVCNFSMATSGGSLSLGRPPFSCQRCQFLVMRWAHRSGSQILTWNKLSPKFAYIPDSHIYPHLEYTTQRSHNGKSEAFPRSCQVTLVTDCQMHFQGKWCHNLCAMEHPLRCHLQEGAAGHHGFIYTLYLSNFPFIMLYLI